MTHVDETAVGYGEAEQPGGDQRGGIRWRRRPWARTLTTTVATMTSLIG